MLTQLSITNLRNITALSFEPKAGLNLILGENGSGKTSVLEAIHMLSLGRSFRARSLKTTIKFNQEQLQITAKIVNDIPVGLQFNLTEGLQIRLNSAPLKRLSELAIQLPMQIISANCHQFFEQGPRYRRQLLDWGLFHVEPRFNYHSQSYRKILQQRNAAIRQHRKDEEISLWDNHLAMHGEAIAEFREQHLNHLLEKFKLLFACLCPEFNCDSYYELKYRTGWSKECSLEQSLKGSLERDKQLGYTRAGSHAADWSIKINDTDPSSIFSRGQQKLFVLALSIAQAKIARGDRDRLLDDDVINAEKSILLIDDISSELDQKHQKIVLELLAALPIQTFVTSTDIDIYRNLENQSRISVFHVKQGKIFE